MENQHARALALLAGNGALLLFWSEFTLDSLETLESNDVRFALILIPLAGLAAGYFALANARSGERFPPLPFRWGEAIALGCFALAALNPVISLGKQLGWTLPF